MASTATPYSESLRKRVLENRESISKLSHDYGVKNVRVFGSVANGNANEDSDIDILVDPDGIRTLFQIGGLQMDLEALLGRKVDLLLSNCIKDNRAVYILDGDQIWVC
jgi:predicted nucleotidyltransferase